METVRIGDLLAGRDPAVPYLELIRHEALSVGLYVLPAGGVDRQEPHGEDEVYHVVAGRGRITVGEETEEIGPGSVVHVAATVPHRFHDIVDDLTILVFFAPAEYTVQRRGADAPGDR